MALFGRFLRLVIFILGIGLGAVATLFAVGNQETIKVTIWTYDYHVQVYALALIPLAAGVAFGWLYTLPARTHEFADHWRSWRTVRRMEKENKQLRRSLDRVLELPDEAEPGREHGKERLALDAEPVAAATAAAPAAKVENGHADRPAEGFGGADMPAELADFEPVAEKRPHRAHSTHAAHAPAARSEATHREKPHAEKALADKAPAEHRDARRPRHEASEATP